MKKIILLLTFFSLLMACSKEETTTENCGGNNQEKPVLKNVKTIKVLTYEGHLHGTSFHFNPGGTLFKRKYVIYYDLQPDNTWKRVYKGEPDELALGKAIPALGGYTEDDLRSHLGTRYSIEITLLNENGEDVTGEIGENQELYQAFFTVDTSDKNSVKAPENGRHLLKYVYRDTNPYNGLVTDSDVAMSKQKVGLKGYFAPMDYGISYPIKVSIFKWKSASEKGNRNYYDLPACDYNAVAVFDIPFDIVTFLGSTDAQTEEQKQKLADYFGVTKQEYEDSEANKPPHSMTGYFL